MPKETKQSILRKLLREIADKSGEFIYEKKMPEKIDWTSYDRAQINEINDMLETIRDMVDKAVENLGIEKEYEERVKQPGRAPVFPGDLAKTVLLQQYFHTSNRLTEGLVRLFREKMKISKHFSYKSVERAYENHDVKRILGEVARLTQVPVSEKERDFSTDGTGLPTSIKYNYEQEKYGKGKKADNNLERFEQAIITIGCKYKLIADFVITENPRAGETPYLKEAVSKISQNYSSVDLWTADSAYLARYNISAIGSIGAKPRIYPKKDDTFRAKGSHEWKQMHYDFIEKPQEWLREYHKRSMSETVNSTLLRMYPRPLSRRIRARRMVEADARYIGYNIKRIVYLGYLEDIVLNLDCNTTS